MCCDECCWALHWRCEELCSSTIDELCVLSYRGDMVSHESPFSLIGDQVTVSVTKLIRCPARHVQTTEAIPTHNRTQLSVMTAISA